MINFSNQVLQKEGDKEDSDGQECLNLYINKHFDNFSSLIWETHLSIPEAKNLQNTHEKDINQQFNKQSIMDFMNNKINEEINNIKQFESKGKFKDLEIFTKKGVDGIYTMTKCTFNGKF